MSAGWIFNKPRLKTVMSHLHAQRRAQLAIEADALAQQEADVAAAQAEADAAAQKAADDKAAAERDANS
jgi:hypothetical protein